MLLPGRTQKRACAEVFQKFAQLQTELQQATAFIEAITRGELTNEIDNNTFREAKTLADAMQAMRAQMQSFSQAERQRNWVIEGQAQFSELLRRYNQDIQELTDQLLKFLIHYIGANQGGVFILNDDKPSERFLEMKACYAYDRKKYTRRIVPIEEGFAEGLIGQVFLEGRITNLRDVPPDYTRITSGLGEATPSHLVLLPLNTNDTTLGVLELASFQAFEKHHLEFLEKVSESIAASLASVKNNETTRRLLLASQEQADTLRAQEEELRQNNEELMATQEEMQRRGNELSSQLETINRSGILLIEFSREGLIQEANEAFFNRFAYQANQLLGKSHHLLAATSDHPARQEENFWLHLQEGLSKSGEYPFLTQNQEKCWIKGAYSPILDAQQKVHKIIFIGFDITEAKAQMEEIHQQALKLQTQERALRQNNEELEQARLALEKKIEELNRFKAEEEKRLKERDAKAQVWVNKLMEKSKQQEALLKAQLAEKDQRIAELENQLIKLN